LIPISKENTEPLPAEGHDRGDNKKDEEEKDIEEPVVEELQPQPVPDQ